MELYTIKQEKEKLEKENKKLKNENEICIEKINNLSYDLKQLIEKSNNLNNIENYVINYLQNEEIKKNKDETLKNKNFNNQNNNNNNNNEIKIEKIPNWYLKLKNKNLYSY